MIGGKVYLGSNQVQKAYLGTNVVYSVSGTPSFPIPTTGTNYYISNFGSTSNDGLSVGSPWPLSKLQGGNDNPIKKYDANFLFKAGEVFEGTVDVGGYYADSPTGKTIIYSAYGTGTKPIITPMAKVPGSDIAGNWTQVPGYTTLWKLQLVPANFVSYTPRIWLDGVETKRARTKEDITPFRRFSWNISDQIIYLYSEDNPTVFYSSVKSTSFVTSTLKVDGQNRVEIRNLDIRGASGACIDIAYTTGIIEDCKIGLDSIREGIRFNGVNGFIVRNNILDTGIYSLDDYYLSTEGGDGIIIGQNPTTNIEVYNNQFYNWVHGGWWLEQINGSHTMSNINIHDNYVTAPSLIYGRGFGAYGLTSSNIKIENNTFDNFSVRNQIGCPGLFFRYNTINGVFNRILDAGHDHGVAYGLQIRHEIYTPQNMNISYNTFKNCAQAGIELGTPFNAPENIIKNNIIDNNTFEGNGGVGRVNPTYDANLTPPNLDIVIRDNSTVQNNTITNNKFKRAAADKCIFYGHDLSDNYLKTVTEFNSLTGVAGDIIGGNTNI